MNGLVKRLSGNQMIAVDTRPENTLQAFKAALDSGYVHVKFVDTDGGTVLGVHLNRDASDLSDADFDHGRGRIKLAGDLVLDYTPVNFHAEIALDTLEGTGSLVPTEDAAQTPTG